VCFLVRGASRVFALVALVALVAGVLACSSTTSDKPDASTSDAAAKDAASSRDNGTDVATWQACQTWLGSSIPTTLPAPACQKLQQTRDQISQLGAVFFPVGKRYAVAWFPPNWDLAQGKLIISLHGTGGCAEIQFSDLYPFASQRGIALVGLQYYTPGLPGDEGYDDDDVILENAQAIVQTVSAHCPIAGHPIFYHGFSRGSAMSYPVAVLDRAGPKLFSAFIADSGATPPGQPVHPTLQSLVAQGSTTGLAGARFWQYCGGQDYGHGAPMCDEVKDARDLVLQLGGAVDQLYEDPAGDHGIFVGKTTATQTDAITSLLNYLDAF
jgi:predicted esterase